MNTWYWPVEISQLNSISRCLISPFQSLLDCNVLNLIYFDWSRSFWIRRWARLIVYGFCTVFTLTKHRYYGKLTVVKTGYPLTRVTWPYQGHVFLKFSTDQLLAFNWSQAEVYVFQSYGSPLKLPYLFGYKPILAISRNPNFELVESA